MTAGRVSVCVFAKPPRVGEVKTRLIPALGAEGAARLAEAFFLDAWAAVSSLDWADPVLATTDVDAPEWAGVPVSRRWPQGSGGLGRRLERVLRRALETHASALAVGTDSPGLPVPLLRAARAALVRHDTAIGPSDDGGFYLLGVRRCPEGLLDGVPWSTDDTCSRAIARIRSAGLTVAVLPPWFDVDRPDDLVRLRALSTRIAAAAPHTNRVLTTLSPALAAAETL